MSLVNPEVLSQLFEQVVLTKVPVARGSLVQKPISKNFTLSISGVKKHGLASPLKSATVFVSAHAVKNAWAGSSFKRGEIRVNPSENLNKVFKNKNDCLTVKE